MSTAVVPKKPGRSQTPLDAFSHAALEAAAALPGPELRAVAGWFLSVSRSRNTLDAYARDLGQFTGFIRSLDGSTLLTATPSHVDAWWQMMTADELAQNTIGRKLAAVSSFYSWAMEPEGPFAELARNPARPTRARRTPKDAGRRTPALSAEQVRAVVSACGDPVTRALVLLLATTGARISEALGTNLADWREREGKQILSVLGKGSKRRDLVLAGEVVQALRETGAPARPASQPLFQDPAGQRLTRSQVGKRLVIVGRRAGLTQRLAAHQFRATYATRARLDQGVDVDSIAEQLGHVSTEMTQVYIREARMLTMGSEINERMAQAILGA